MGGYEMTDFTPRAIGAFRSMPKAEAACKCEDGSGLCDACLAWWRWHKILHAELGLRPWQYPCVEKPDTTSPFPTGSEADRAWKPDLAAQERWRALRKAARELAKQPT
jgi:hypothetical protein